MYNCVVQILPDPLVIVSFFENLKIKTNPTTKNDAAPKLRFHHNTIVEIIHLYIRRRI